MNSFCGILIAITGLKAKWIAFVFENLILGFILLEKRIRSCCASFASFIDYS